MKARTTVFVVVFALLLIAAAALRISSRGTETNTRGRPKTLVKVELPSHQELARNLMLTGDILPIRQAKVFSRVSGNLESADVNIGDFVRAGQVLAHIDTTELAQQCRQAQATYMNAKAVYDRSQPLIDQNLISQQDFDNAETSMKVAKDNFEAARTRLDYAIITAPFSGYITKRYLDPGALVNSSNSTLFDLMDLDTIKVDIDVLEKDVPLISVGMKAVAAVDAYADSSFTGKVARLSQAVDLSTRTMPVEIDIPNRDHLLKPGMFATVSLILGKQHDALMIPTQALLRDTKGYYVLTAQNGLARRQEVVPGAEQESRTEIVTGISAADSIITTGQQFTHDGGPVTVQP